MPSMPALFLGHGSVAGPYDWALRFDTQVRGLLQAGDDASLVENASLGPDAHLAIPTPDHYLPLLPLLGAGRAGEPVTFPVEGFDGGSMSMLAVKFG
jgi:4,5-DOPA dioxygenase extradiol